MSTDELKQAVERIAVLKGQITYLEGIIGKQAYDLQKKNKRITELEQLLNELTAEKHSLENEVDYWRGY
jgi:chromosome segregation ATPase